MLCNCYDNFDFSARWITLAGSDAPNTALEFFASFNDNGQEEKILRISAESCYSLYINGVFIGKGPVRGCWNINFFDAYDVSKILHPGENIIAVRVHSMNDLKNFNYHPAGCGLIAEIPGILSTDTSWRVRRVPGWHNTQEVYSFQQGFKVEYDLNCANPEWFLGKDAESWENAVIFDNDALALKKLCPRNIPPLVYTRIIPVLHKAVDPEPCEPETDETIADLLDRETFIPTDRVTSSGNNCYRIAPGENNCTLIFDFKKVCTGYFDMEVTVDEPGVEVHVTTGENIWNDRVRSCYRRKIDHAAFVDSFFLKPGKNRISNEFLAHGGSMLQVAFRNIHKEVIIDSPVYCDRRYPYSGGSTFLCSDHQLNQIWNMCRETISACTTDTFEDGPWREHAFWVNDLVVENIASLVLFGMSDIHRRSLELTFAQQYDSGWCPGAVPAQHDPETQKLVLVPTNFFLFTVLDDCYRESGDSEILRRYLPNLKKILDAAEATCDADGLINPPEKLWNFFDWGYELNNITFNDSRCSMLNSLYIHALKLYCRFCRITGVEYPSEELEMRIERIKKALPLYLNDEGIVVDPAQQIHMETRTFSPTALASELSMAFALQCGAWGIECEKRFVEAIISGKYLSPELYLSSVIFDEIGKRGGAQEALDRIRKYWGQFIRMGLSTIPESGVHLVGKVGYWENGSFCHGFTTGPVKFFRQVLLGIKDVDDGFSSFVFAPQSLDLEYASGSVATPHGEILVSWQRNGDSLDAELTVPAGCIASLPDGRKLYAGTHTVKVALNQ